MDISEIVNKAMADALKEVADAPANRKLDADIAERKEILKALKGEIKPNKQGRQ